MATEVWFVAICCDSSLFERERTELQFMNQIVKEHRPHIKRMKQRDRVATFWSFTMGYAQARQMKFDAFECDSEYHSKLLIDHARKILDARHSSRARGSDYLLLLKFFGKVGSAPEAVPTKAPAVAENHSESSAQENSKMRRTGRKSRSQNPVD